jgi:hypothetical protein
MKRAAYGGSTEARPDQKMSRRVKQAWPFANKRNRLEVLGESHASVTTGLRQELQKQASKKRRQRDRTEEEQ